uniref:Transposase n=1 Tax=Meloidogyne hapla TaxID=6305 RepID=A0A1I8BCT1_MELHA
FKQVSAILRIASKQLLNKCTVHP